MTGQMRRGARGHAPGGVRSSVTWAVMCLAIAVAALTWLLPHQRDFFDFRIYWAATHSWLSGDPLYSFEKPGTTLGFTYPPFAGLVLAPFSFFPVTVAAWVLCGISLAVLVGVAMAIGAAMSRALRLPRLPTVVAVLALSLGIEPVRESLSFGQINIVLLGLMVLDMWLIARRSA
ncbi:MAG: glycosyltransferase 87 family protein, partial [Frankiaceae bacterium]|nr:glycosyltransferase 87 family protein [Frankiaceae bacterium]